MMPDLARARAIFALQQLPANLRSAVLADGNIASHFDIGIDSPVRLLDKTVNREQLFAPFREAADGKVPAPLLDLSGTKVEAFIEIDNAGDGSVRIGNTNIRFPQAGLLASEATQRQAYADRMLADYTLAAKHKTEFLTQVSQP